MHIYIYICIRSPVAAPHTAGGQAAMTRFADGVTTPLSAFPTTLCSLPMFYQGLPRI